METCDQCVVTMVPCICWTWRPSAVLRARAEAAIYSTHPLPLPSPLMMVSAGLGWAGLGWAGLGWAGIVEGSHLIELSATGHSASRENPNCQ